MNITVNIPKEKQVFNSDQLDKDAIFKLNAAAQKEVIFYNEEIIGYIIIEDNTKIDTSHLLIQMKQILRSDENNDENNDDTGSLINFELSSKDILLEGDISGKYYVIVKFDTSVTYPRNQVYRVSIQFSCRIKNDGRQEALNVFQGEAKGITSVLEDFIPCRKRGYLSEVDLPSIPNEDDLKDIAARDVPEINSLMTTKKFSTLEVLEIPVRVPLTIKLKSAKPAGKNHILYANFSIEASPELVELFKKGFCNGFQIQEVALDFTDGNYEDLNFLKFPLCCRVEDSLSLTYKFYNVDISEKEPRGEYGHALKNVSILINCRIIKFEDSSAFKAITNKISTRWTPLLDFALMAPPINDYLKTSNSPLIDSQTSFSPKPARKNAYRILSSAATDTNIAINSSSSNLLRKNTKIFSSIPSPVSMTVNLTTTNSALYGLVLTFLGKLSLHVGEIIEWKLQALNTSQSSMNLSLYVHNSPTVRTTATPRVDSQSSPSLVHTKPEVAELALQNRLQLFNTYSALKEKANGIMILNNDIRFGTLEPKRAFETSIQLLGISSGIYNLQGLRIFDISSGDGLDFGKLVEAFVI